MSPSPTPRTHPVWYLLYGGSSEDGSGPGTYMGRTTDSDVAFKHAKECDCDSYSAGYVIAVTDRREIRVSAIELPGYRFEKPAWDRFIASL